jgi:uroporphyrinogen decarboxylase
VEAWGGDVIYYEDGPPNSGRPFIREPEQIRLLEPPKVLEAPSLLKVLKTEQMLKPFANDVPIIGVVMSPFSLPVMQMGFDRYLDLMYENPELFERLMRVNEEFCVEWANAQLRAGANAIVYYDPVSSPTVTPTAMYAQWGFPVARRTLSRITGPTVTHFASGICLPIIEAVAETGTKVIGVSRDESLAAVKRASKHRLAVAGNLNAIEMRRWSPREAEEVVKATIADGGPGGGFVLSDNHGEIPYQVPEEVLLAISEATRKWGRYPLDWVEEYENAKRTA